MSAYRSEHLAAHHELDRFSSGNAPLDNWLSRERAAAFYARYGFRPCPDPRRLVRKTSDIAAALGVGSPQSSG